MNDLETILAVMESRFDFDVRGRIVASSVEGVLPRFVLGRAAEGCIWRFGAGLSPTLVRQVARLAGRERGLGLAGAALSPPPGAPPPPDRLVMIERALAAVAAVAGSGQARGTMASQGTHREILTRHGVLFAEIWTLR